MKTTRLKGKVFSGKGLGEFFVSLSWVQKQLKDRVGFEAYPGTLNLKLSSTSTGLRRRLEKKASFRIIPAQGYRSGIVFNAEIDDLKCAVIIPEVVGYPSDVLEVVAPTNLREKLRVHDGDELAVKVYY
jgi:riboflavin kinase